MHYLNYKVFKRATCGPSYANRVEPRTNIVITGAHNHLKRDMVAIVDSYRYTFETSRKREMTLCLHCSIDSKRSAKLGMLKNNL